VWHVRPCDGSDDAAALIAGIWIPALGVVGAIAETGVFGWVLARQADAGDRGRALGAYGLFAAMALAAAIVDAVRL
jgi:hypothetical protein